MIFAIMYALLWLPAKLFFHLKVVGKKKIPKNGGVLLACNHFTNWDVILLQINLPRRLFYLAKKELMKNKLVGWFLRKLGAFPVERGAGDIAATKFALSTLKNGKALCLFPEGTRNKTSSEDLQALKSGSIVFSAKTGSPLVPMMFLKKPKVLRRNVLVVGDPIEFNFQNPARPSKEEIEEATQKLAECMNNLQKEYLPKYYKKHQNK